MIIELDHVDKVIHPQMEKLKKDYFQSHPDDPIILHRKDMMNAKFPFKNLINPNVRIAFDKELLGLLSQWEYTVVSVCLDKKIHKETYQTWRYDPYHYCLKILLERYVLYLRALNSKGDVMAESRGGKADIRLKKSYSRLWESGTEYIEPEQIQKVLTSKQLKVKTKSNNIVGLQLADLIAHPSRNEILYENGLLDKELAPFTKKIINVLKHKYYQKDEKIFGKKLL